MPAQGLGKRAAARLPKWLNTELRRLHYARQIRSGRFSSDEPELALLPELVEPGDWVIDVGANVGRYTMRLSDLVGRQGRVIALESIPKKPSAFSCLMHDFSAMATSCS